MLEKLFNKKKKQDQDTEEEKSYFLTTQRIIEILNDPKLATEDEIKNLAYTVLETLDILSNAIIQSIGDKGDPSKLH
jgi:hypothetical protein